MSSPQATAFFDPLTNTVSYLVADTDTNHCAVIDSLLDYDAASGTMHTQSADLLIQFIRKEELTVDWIIDTHVRADHLTAAQYIKQQLGGRTAIGNQIKQVQKVFGEIFNEGQEFHTDGSQFDHLFADNESYLIGNITAKAIHTPGHTPACMVHWVGGAVFVGDTLFMPDYGTARCDFPGGDANQLYQSIQKIFELPDTTRMYLCHDYKTAGRDEFAWESTVGEQKRHNIHVHVGSDEQMFVTIRTALDGTLSMPKLILPLVQVDMPPAEDDGKRYLKIPINAFAN